MILEVFSILNDSVVMKPVPIVIVLCFWYGCVDASIAEMLEEICVFNHHFYIIASVYETRYYILLSW